MSPRYPIRGRRPTAAPSRAPRDAVEWRRTVYRSTRLSPPAKLSVVALGDFMDWRHDPGVNAYLSKERLSRLLGSQSEPETVRKHLSSAVRLGHLVVTSDPSPERPVTTYRAAIPTGTAAPSADVYLPLEVPEPPRPHRHPVAGGPFEHRQQDAFEHRHPVAGRSVEDLDQKPQDPPTPRDRPLLSIIDGEGNPGGSESSSAALSAAVLPQLVAHGLLDRLELTTSTRIAKRRERQVLSEVTRLVAAGWRLDDLIEHAVAPTWDRVRDHGAVLLRRLEMLGPAPDQHLASATDLRPPQCGRCDVNRQVELPDGRMRRCPACHPLEVADAPF